MKRAQQEKIDAGEITPVDDGEAGDSLNPFFATVQKRARNARKKLVRLYLW
jgi:hypothetical protein